MYRITNTQYFHFLHQADAFRRSGSLCDAIISVKSQTFKAHRLVLACASRRLAQQLAQADNDSPVHCTLEHFLPRTFQQVLDFMYTQTLEVSVEDLHLLLRAAKLLEMEPLEEQCQKQLDNLPFRTSAEITAVRDRESAEEMDKKQDGSPVREKKLTETTSPVEEARGRVVMENLGPSDSTKSHNSSPSPKKKPRISHLTANSNCSDQDDGAARPGSSGSSVFSPWTFPTNMWSSVSTLRRIAENYSNYLAHYPNPSSVVNPFPLSTPHMLPLLGSHFQSSVMAYPSFHPRFTQNIYTGSTGVGTMIKQGLLKRKKPNQRVFTGAAKTSELRYHEEPKASTERVKDCQHCSTSLLCDPELQDSSCTSGVTCGGCQICRKGDLLEQESPSNQQEHRGEKPYQCQHCPKRFSLKHQLDTHHRVHTGEKPFECRLCGQRSRDYSAMIKHLRTHGGAAPYQCTVCLEFCSSLVAMQRHVKGHAVQDFPPDWSISSTYLYTSHI